MTSSDSSDIPGFVVEELIQISFENDVLGKSVFFFKVEFLQKNLLFT